MPQEIERKFLVRDDSYKAMAYGRKRIRQGYICSERGRTVRVRIQNEEGYLTIKGPSDVSGMSRYEWEYALPLQEAEELMKLCEPGMIDKLVIWYDGGRTFLRWMNSTEKTMDWSWRKLN